MDRTQRLRQLDEMLELSPGTLSGDEELADLEKWDSLAMMNFIAFASDECGLTLSPRQFTTCKTSGDLLKLLDGKS